MTNPQPGQSERRIGSEGPAACAAGDIRRRTLARRGGHDPRPSCALCNGDGDICNPGNADPAVKITDWLPPVGCPRCGQTGKDPNP